MHSVRLRVSGEFITAFEYQAPDAGTAKGDGSAQANWTRTDDEYFELGFVAHFQ